MHFRFPGEPLTPVEVYRVVNASTDPDLARAALTESGDGVLNLVRATPDGRAFVVAVSFVYHDPERRVFALVLPEGARHREFEERAELLAELDRERELPVPDYVASFSVVYGAGELGELLETSAEELVERARLRDRMDDLEVVSRELTERERLLDEREKALGAREQALGERELEMERAELATRPVADRPAPDFDPHRAPTEPKRPVRTARADEVTERALPPPDDDDITEQLFGGDTDTALERWMASRSPTMKKLDDEGTIHLVAAIDGGPLEAMLESVVEPRLQLHRLAPYPLVTLSIAAPAAFEGSTGHEPLTFFFDVRDTTDRAILDLLSREFRFLCELYDGEYLPVHTTEVQGPLALNTAIVVEEADRWLEQITLADRSFEAAVLEFQQPDHDRFARKAAEAELFAPAIWRSLGRPSEVRAALGLVRRLSTVDGEDFLVLTRGYPLEVWYRERREVLERAIDVGLWMGAALAEVAVVEQLATNMSELLKSLRRSFSEITAEDARHDLDEEAVRMNWAALDAQRLAIEDEEQDVRRSESIESSQSPEVSGEISVPGRRRRRVSVGGEPAMDSVDTEEARFHAIMKLCEGRRPEVLPEVFASLDEMRRDHAGRVLVEAIRAGSPVIPFLISGLSSGKVFVRHGCALGLGLLPEPHGIVAVCELLAREPTEIWRELARALGQAGAQAIAPMAPWCESGSVEVRERIAWALAYIAARHGLEEITPLEADPGPMAVAARRARQELMETAARDDAAIRGPRPAPDQTASQAFSRRFFQALGAASETEAPPTSQSDSDVYGYTGNGSESPDGGGQLTT